jgi:hypothetical protein
MTGAMTTTSTVTGKLTSAIARLARAASGFRGQRTQCGGAPIAEVWSSSLPALDDKFETDTFSAT